MTVAEETSVNAAAVVVLTSLDNISIWAGEPWMPAKDSLCGTGIFPPPLFGNSFENSLAGKPWVLAYWLN